MQKNMFAVRFKTTAVASEFKLVYTDSQSKNSTVFAAEASAAIMASGTQDDGAHGSSEGGSSTSASASAMSPAAKRGINGNAVNAGAGASSSSKNGSTPVSSTSGSGEGGGGGSSWLSTGVTVFVVAGVVAGAAYALAGDKNKAAVDKVVAGLVKSARSNATELTKVAESAVKSVVDTFKVAPKPEAVVKAIVKR